MAAAMKIRRGPRTPLFVIVVVLIAVLGILTMYRAFLPGIESDGDAEESTAQYLSMVYRNFGDEDNQSLKDVWQRQSFMWNNASLEIKEKFPIAENLSVKWPLPKDSRCRLTAFPYPPKAKSGWWIVNFARGLTALLNNSSTAVTFPGWLVSIYDPLRPNSNDYGTQLAELLHSDRQALASVDEDMNEDQWIEVIHACYPPPNVEYPRCDDGGYWLYMAPGSGVYWKTGRRCLLANNKIDALYRMLDTPAGEAMITRQKFKDATALLVSHLQGTGGGTRLVSALRDVIEAMQKGRRVPKITAFRNMAAGDARGGWLLFCTFVVVALAVVGGSLVRTGISVYRVARGTKNAGRQALISGGVAAAAVAAVAALGWFVVAETTLRGFGYVTLDQALQLSQFSTVSEIVEASRSGNDVVANSLAMVQNFDIMIELLAKDLKLTSIVMHAQPNKSGSWAVEILDMQPVSETNFSDGLGLCGGDETVFMQGIRRNEKAFLSYEPTDECECDEAIVKQEFDSGNPLASCTFCTHHLSQRLCTSST
jgi:hypothetical protein